MCSVPLRMLYKDSLPCGGRDEVQAFKHTQELVFSAMCAHRGTMASRRSAAADKHFHTNAGRKLITDSGTREQPWHQHFFKTAINYRMVISCPTISLILF